MDLPGPVVPAISRCGNCVKSRLTGSPVIFSPAITESCGSDLSSVHLVKQWLKETVFRDSFFTSNPMYGVPRIKSIIRISVTFRERHNSGIRAEICELRIPGEGANRKSVNIDPSE
nr:hypothetical protein [Morganella morganii]